MTPIPAGSLKLANPRLTDAFGLPLKQVEVDFAIPHLTEDLRLYIDPFLLWSSPETPDQALHQLILDFLDEVRHLTLAGKQDDAFLLLRTPPEPREMGLGYAVGTKAGRPAGSKVLEGVLGAFQYVPQLSDGGLRHAEELQLVVPGLAEDGISDLVTALLKDFFIDFTVQRAATHSIPTKAFMVDNVWDPDRKLWRPKGRVQLPYNPIDDSPLLLAPLRLLRHLPWINYEDYYRSGYAPYVLGPRAAGAKRVAKPVVLRHNREHYTTVRRYVDERERQRQDCRPDPLFCPLSPATLKKKFAQLRAIPTGKAEKHDRLYEDLACDLLSTLLYPSLEFAASQVRTVSGAHIRDLVLYNDGKTTFLRDIRNRHEVRQPVFELKNVRQLEPEHVNQLWRYLGSQEFGHLGVLVTRNPCPAAVERNIVDLHSAKRGVILTMDDSDIELMLNLVDVKRDPVEVVKKRYLHLMRKLPQ